MQFSEDTRNIIDALQHCFFPDHLPITTINKLDAWTKTVAHKGGWWELKHGCPYGADISGVTLSSMSHKVSVFWIDPLEQHDVCAYWCGTAVDGHHLAIPFPQYDFLSANELYCLAAIIAIDIFDQATRPNIITELNSIISVGKLWTFDHINWD